jgi:glucose-6-phosphate isomerase
MANSFQTLQEFNLGAYQKKVDAKLAEIKQHRIMSRIWAHDHTVWKPDPIEITDRLGWLDTTEAMQAALPRLQSLAEKLRAEGYTYALLLGMGGSSLAPEVFRKVFGAREGFLDLSVLDSTDPGAVLSFSKRLENQLDKTLFIVSTKSGTTVETLSFFKYFYNLVAGTIGVQRAGEHFIAITDPGSKLADLASKYNFRAVFLNDPNIGGRYSALSYFGLVPATLIGVDLERLLDCALVMSKVIQGSDDLVQRDNQAARLGVIMGELANTGRDKLTLVTSPAIAIFGDWVEQLIAESTGKGGKGILPVVGETLGNPNGYGSDRLFVCIHLEGETTFDQNVQTLIEAGQPLIRLQLKDEYDLGAQFFLWEIATAVAGYCLGINPFDQPNVEAAKVLARQMVTAYQKDGKLPEQPPKIKTNLLSVYTDLSGGSLSEVFNSLLSYASPGAYISLQAYIQPCREADTFLLALREKLRDLTRLATTAGYGPRFLHSTGQLYKGDGGRGLFIQITSRSPSDVPIPNEAGSPASSMSFGVLKMAQALGDYQALQNAGRRVIRIHLKKDVNHGLGAVLGMLN